MRNRQIPLSRCCDVLFLGRDLKQGTRAPLSGIRKRRNGLFRLFTFLSVLALISIQYANINFFCLLLRGLKVPCLEDNRRSDHTNWFNQPFSGEAQLAASISANRGQFQPVQLSLVSSTMTDTPEIAQLSWPLVPLIAARIALFGIAVLFFFRAAIRYRNQIAREKHQLDRILLSVSDAVFTRTNAGIFTSWNDAAEDLFGYEVKEVVGTRFVPALSGEASDMLNMFMRTLAEGKELHGLHAKCKHKNGVAIEVFLSGIPYRNENEEVAGAFILAREANAFASAEEVRSNRDVEARLRALIDHTADAIALVSADGKTLFCSAATEQILGFPANEACGRSIYQFVHKEDLDATKRAFEQSLACPGERIKVRTRLRHENGSWLCVEAVLNNLLQVPTIQAILINFRDITEAVTAEEAARKSNERFVRAFRSSPLAISISTRDEGRYIDVNEAFLEMFGVTRDAVVGRTSSVLSIWADTQGRQELLEELERTNHRRRPVHTRLRAMNGEIRDVDIYAELTEMEGTQCVLAITHDVTVAKRIETQFLRAQRMEAVGRLAGGLAHDFNNVLGVIIGHSEIAQERLGAGHVVSRNISQIKKAADRAAALIRQLLAFSRQQLLYPRVLDLNVVVQNLNEMLVPLLGEDISLIFKPGAYLGSIRADLGQIEQVVMNLVVNARDAMPVGGRLTIETADVELDSNYAVHHSPVLPGEYVMLAISDTGCGITDEALPHIFEPFFTTKGPGSGTGLGLSTVYGIVKQSNGYIWVYSELEKGTTFKIYFPRIREKPEHPVIPEVDQEVSLDTVGGTILVVEDDELLRSLVVRLLDLPDYRVLEAESAQAAMDLVARHNGKIDLLLTDVVMPSISGGELAARIRALHPRY